MSSTSTSEVSLCPVILTWSMPRPHHAVTAEATATVWPPATMPAIAVSAEERGGELQAGVPRHLPVEPRQDADRLPQEARQDELATADQLGLAFRSCPYRLHDASSTIHRTSP